jgi:hypothetical protein
MPVCTLLYWMKFNFRKCYLIGKFLKKLKLRPWSIEGNCEIFSLGHTQFKTSGNFCGSLLLFPLLIFSFWGKSSLKNKKEAQVCKGKCTHFKCELAWFLSRMLFVRFLGKLDEGIREACSHGIDRIPRQALKRRSECTIIRGSTSHEAAMFILAVRTWNLTEVYAN